MSDDDELLKSIGYVKDANKNEWKSEIRDCQGINYEFMIRRCTTEEKREYGTEYIGYPKMIGRSDIRYGTFFSNDISKLHNNMLNSVF